jgi:uncharacterized protein YjbI with pentapeptide repeats
MIEGQETIRRTAAAPKSGPITLPNMPSARSVDEPTDLARIDNTIEQLLSLMGTKSPPKKVGDENLVLGSPGGNYAWWVFRKTVLVGDFSGAKFAGARLEDTTCDEANFRGASFQKATIYGVNLSQNNLSGCDLREAYLGSVNLPDNPDYLRDTDLRVCTFYRCSLLKDLSACKLSGAKFRECKFSSKTKFPSDLKDCDFSNCDLTLCDLSECDLRGADLRGAKLPTNPNHLPKDLTGCNLSGCDLRNLDLSEFKLQGCNFKVAQLPPTTNLPRDLQKCNFEEQDLFNYDLSECVLRGANLSGAKLPRDPHRLPKDLTGCDLSLCDLRHLDLSQFTLRGCDVSGAKFSQDTRFPNDLQGSIFMGMGSDLSNYDLSKCDLRGANLSGATLPRDPNHLPKDLTGCDLSLCDLRHLDLSQFTLQGCDFRGATFSQDTKFPKDLQGCIFAGQDLSSYDLSNSNVQGADFTRAKLPDRRNLPTDLRNCRFGNQDLTAFDLSLFNLEGASFRGANLSGMDLSNLDLSKWDLRGAVLSMAILPEDQNHLPKDLSGCNLSSCDLSRYDLAKFNLSKAIVPDQFSRGANDPSSDKLFSSLQELIPATNGNLLYSLAWPRGTKPPHAHLLCIARVGEAFVLIHEDRELELEGPNRLPLYIRTTIIVDTYGPRIDHPNSINFNYRPVNDFVNLDNALENLSEVINPNRSKMFGRGPSITIIDPHTSQRTVYHTAGKNELSARIRRASDTLHNR